ncbi:MAG: hypothetical protein HQ515_03630 [Phycisphaeraceae bacterium]|nr:hypothetical protein [Phycisphaeraceae bacterium]
MTKSTKSNGLIVDANILIDYAKSGPSILLLVSKYIQQLYVPLPILHEVKDLSRSDIEKLGIDVVEPSLTQLINANELRQTKPTLSGQDAICLVMAEDNEWICLTNDKPLRSLCYERNIDCLWGLEIMIQLVSMEKLTVEEAYRTALDIQSKNKYIKAETVERFKKKLRR